MNQTRLFSQVRNLEIQSVRLLESLVAGQYRSVFKGPGLEFAEVREYAEGDDPRHIDWNVSSRHGSLYTKTFREERELTLFLVVDLSSSVFSPRGAPLLHESVEMLCALFSFAAIRTNDRVGACFFSDRIERWVPPAKGRSHALSLVRDLLSIEPAGTGSNLALALRTTGESLKRRGIVVVLSDFKTETATAEFMALSRRHDVIGIRLVSLDDVEFPQGATFEMRDPESGVIQTGYGRSGTFRRAYREFWALRRKTWFQDMRSARVSPLEINTDDDPVVRIIHFFERRRQRAGGR